MSPPVSLTMLYDCSSEDFKKPAGPAALHCRCEGRWNLSFSRVGGKGLVKSGKTVANRKRNYTSRKTTFKQSVATAGEQPELSYFCVPFYVTQRHTGIIVKPAFDSGSWTFCSFSDMLYFIHVLHLDKCKVYCILYTMRLYNQNHNLEIHVTFAFRTKLVYSWKEIRVCIHIFSFVRSHLRQRFSFLSSRKYGVAVYCPFSAATTRWTPLCNFLFGRVWENRGAVLEASLVTHFCHREGLLAIFFAARSQCDAPWSPRSCITHLRLSLSLPTFPSVGDYG
jgi:hypothetical protein